MDLHISDDLSRLNHKNLSLRDHEDIDGPVIPPAPSALTVNDLVVELHLWNSDLSLDPLDHVELLLDDL